MSSTISVSRRAAAFRTKHGIFYALFESTYESNVSPKVPHESCVAFGSAQQVLVRVLRCLGPCAGGMLRARGGSFSAEGYLKAWLSELKAPRELPDTSIELSMSDRLYAPIPTGTDHQDMAASEAALAALREHGYQSQADTIAAGGKVLLSLYDDAPVLAAIYGAQPERRHVAPWRVIKPNYRTLQHLELGASFPPPAAPPAMPEVYRPGFEPADATNYLVYEEVAGRWRISPTSTVIDHVCGTEASTRELREPGAGLALAQAFLASVKGGFRPLPGDAVIRFDLRNIHDDYAYPFMLAAQPSRDVAAGKQKPVEIVASDLPHLPSGAAQMCSSLTYCASVEMPAYRDAPAGTTGDLFAQAA